VKTKPNNFIIIDILSLIIIKRLIFASIHPLIIKKRKNFFYCFGCLFEIFLSLVVNLNIAKLGSTTTEITIKKKRNIDKIYTFASKYILIIIQ
jgi:hypothetical protein